MCTVASMSSGMQFGVLQFFSWSRRVPLETVYARAFDRIAIMDEGGYDCVWLAEHHFTTYSVCPSVHLMGMAVAGRTKNLRIGMAVSLAAMYHPLRLAEEVALLDVLSGGRVNWGAGRGFDPREFRTFGIPPEESSDRFREAVTIVHRAWREERLTFHGRFWQFEDVEVLPRPLQQPEPPSWVGVTSPDAIAWAAKEGHSILMDPHSAHGDIGRKLASYREQLEAAGHRFAGRAIPMARLIAVAETEAEAERVARNGASWTVGSYARPTKGSPFAAPDPVQRYLDDVIIYGTPEKVTDTLLELRETIPLRYLMCAPLSHESFVLFTKKVLPRLL